MKSVYSILLFLSLLISSAGFAQSQVGLNESTFHGLMMVFNEDNGTTLREMIVVRTKNKLQFTIADTHPLRFSVKISDAQFEQVRYPFGIPHDQPARALLESMQWKQLEIPLTGTDSQIKELLLYFKPTDLMREEGRNMPRTMPPLHRILLKVKSDEPFPIIQGGLYSHSEVKAGAMKKAIKALRRHYKIIRFNQKECEQDLL